MKKAAWLVILITIITCALPMQLAAETIQLNASVPPQTSDLPVAIASATSGSPFPQYTTITYKVTYGSNLPYSAPLTISVSWSDATDGSSSYEIVEYKTNSATKAYNNTSPVIDTLNRTITWSIASFPANTTGQTVTFQLKTTDVYTGPDTLSYTVSANASSGGTTTPDQTLTHEYLYDPAITPTPTLTPTPTITPTPTPGPTSTPQPGSTATPIPTIPTTPTPTIRLPLAITGVDVGSLAQSTAGITITNTTPVTLTISYGTLPGILNQTITSLTPALSHTISFDTLNPDTRYYFRTTATDLNGNSITSDIFTFRTARVSQVPEVNKQTIIITSNNTTLLSGVEDTKALQKLLLLPQGEILTLSFALTQPEKVKSIQSILRNKQVLAATTLQKPTGSSRTANLMEIRPGFYSGSLAIPATHGMYELFIRIQDYNGNLTEQKLQEIKVDNKFTVVDQNQRPIEKTEVLFSLYNKTNKMYELIDPQALQIQNPSFSDKNGKVAIVLPQGMYKADLKAVGYEEQSITFTIGPNSTDGYPTVVLEKKPFSPLIFFKSLKESSSDLFTDTRQFIAGVTDSQRTQMLLSVVLLMSVLLLLYLSLAVRLHLSPLLLPAFFFYTCKNTVTWKHNNSISGTINCEQSGKPLTHAAIYVFSAKTKKILCHTKTNSIGYFSCPLPSALSYDLQIAKKGWKTKVMKDISPSNLTKQTISATLQPLQRSQAISHTLLFLGRHILHTIVEALLLFSIIVEILFGIAYGVIAMLPFFALSVTAFILWFSAEIKTANTNH